MLFFRSADFFKLNFLKILFGNTIRVPNNWVQIRPDIFSGLIWVQTVCMGYQQKKNSRQELRVRMTANNIFHLIILRYFE